MCTICTKNAEYAHLREVGMICPPKIELKYEAHSAMQISQPPRWRGSLEIVASNILNFTFRIAKSSQTVKRSKEVSKQRVLTFFTKWSFSSSPLKALDEWFTDSLQKFLVYLRWESIIKQYVRTIMFRSWEVSVLHIIFYECKEYPKAHMDRAASKSHSYLVWKKSPSCFLKYSKISAMILIWVFN